MTGSGLIRTLVAYRQILLQTTASEVRFRYAGSLLGAFWLALAPLLLMAIYAGVYLVIFRVRPPDMSAEHYVLYVLSGLIPFMGFSEALSAGSSWLTLNKAILLNTVFPAELVPLRAVLSSQAPTAVGILVTALIGVALGLGSPALLAIPLIWLALVMFVSGIVWILSLASLVARDVSQLLVFLNMALLVVCPIGYTEAMVPPVVRPLVYLNPLSHYIDAFHDVIVFARWPSLAAWAVMLGCGAASLGLGFWVFQRAKRMFFDYA